MSMDLAMNGGRNDLVAELEEAKLRVAQMEKSTRWLNDCVANWRLKWTKCKNERNKAKDELKHIRGQFEQVTSENMTLRRDKQVAEKQLVDYQTESRLSRHQIRSQSLPYESMVSKSQSHEQIFATNRSHGLTPIIQNGVTDPLPVNSDDKTFTTHTDKGNVDFKTMVSVAKVYFKEINECISNEGFEDDNMKNEILDILNELDLLKLNLRAAKTSTREKCNSKNAGSYDRVAGLEERKIGRGAESTTNTKDKCEGIPTLEQAMKQKTDDMTELKAAYNQLKKVFQEKCEELANSIRQSEHNQSEIRKLKVKVESLKGELAAVEDELHNNLSVISNTKMKNCELEEIVRQLNLEVCSLKNRLKNTNHVLFSRQNPMASDFDYGEWDSNTEEHF